MKKFSEMRIGRLSGVIRSVLTGLCTFLLLFGMILTGITPDQYDIHVGQPPARRSTPQRMWKIR